MKFEVGPVSSVERFLLTFVALHGFTDVRDPVNLYPYVLLPFLPTHAVTFIFGACSVHHFAADLSLIGSLLLHAVLTLLFVYKRTISAFRVFMAFMCLVHLPFHYWTIWGEATAAARLAVFTSLFISSCAATFQPAHVVFSENAQRLVIAHVIAAQHYI